MNKNILKKIALKVEIVMIFLIKTYQICFSLFFGYGKCRFYPTCSNYFMENIKKNGMIRGSFFGIVRICKCHPFCRGGNDPVK
ncbi:MAG: putative membrane protein insertion efficiency factor [Rickettsiales bacterium]|jgi:putative membrane protein insertion efficiency factor